MACGQAYRRNHRVPGQLGQAECVGVRPDQYPDDGGEAIANGADLPMSFNALDGD